MRYYILEQDLAFSKWRVMLPEEEEKGLQLKQHITFEEFWATPQVIHLKMVAKQLLVSTVDYVDIHLWQHDLSLGMVPPPSAPILVLSPAMKALLEGYYCPEYRFYPAKTSNYFNDSDQEKEYFVFHLKEQMREQLCYTATSFGIFEDYSTTPKLIHTYPVGEITSYEQVAAISSSIRKEKGVHFSLQPLKHIYKKPYQIVWGPGKKILINEVVKKAIEAGPFTGIALKEFTKYEIITGFQG